MTDDAGPVPADVADRRAVERVRGRPLSRTWPTSALAAGSRVTVVRDVNRDGPWRVEFTGTIDAMGAPEPNGHVQALDGELLYWVTFDMPQFDSGGAVLIARPRSGIAT